MTGKFPNPDHLTDEEIDYELRLRGRLEDLVLVRDAKCRVLRNLFYDDARNDYEYDPPYTMDQDFDHITIKVRNLREKLDNGFDEKCLSRLRAYFHRVMRLATTNDDEKVRKRELAEEMLQIFVTFDANPDKQPDEIPDGTPGIEEYPEKGKGTETLEKGPKTDPKKDVPKTPGKTYNSATLHKRIEDLEQQLVRACLAWSGVDACQPGPSQINQRPRHRADEESQPESIPWEEEEELRRKRRQNRYSIWESRRQRADGDRGHRQGKGQGFQDERDRTPPLENNRPGEIDHGSRNYENNRSREGTRRSKEIPDQQHSSHRSRVDDLREDLGHGFQEPRRQPEHRDSLGRNNRSPPEDDRRSRENPEQRHGSRQSFLNDHYRRDDPGRGFQEVRYDSSQENGYESWEESTQRGSQVFGNRGDHNDDIRSRFSHHSQLGNRDHGRHPRVGAPERRRHVDRRRRNAEIGDAVIQTADRRMEKWHLTFNGDTSQRSLEDFLHKVHRLAEMDRIAEDVLLQRIHTILRGEAYDWYLCYAEDFLHWDDFEMSFRYMYGNPHRDQSNRKRIYGMKQRSDEPFLTYKMEIERLNKLLRVPLDQERLFEVMWDNCKSEYKDRLVCREIENLVQLEYYAVRIDANDPELEAQREGTSRPKYGSNFTSKHQRRGQFKNSHENERNHREGHARVVHYVEVGGETKVLDSSESEPEEVNMLERKMDQQPKAEWSQTSPSCWNCHKKGHLWRRCQERKTMFCYVCGTPEKTAITCPNHKNGSGN